MAAEVTPPKLFGRPALAAAPLLLALGGGMLTVTLVLLDERGALPAGEPLGAAMEPPLAPALGLGGRTTVVLVVVWVVTLRCGGAGGATTTVVLGGGGGVLSRTMTVLEPDAAGMVVTTAGSGSRRVAK